MEATDPAAAASAAIEAARDLQRGVRAPGTERAYRSDWTHFAAFCRAAGFTPLPAAPETVAAYVASMERSHAYASVRRHLSAIARAHRLAGHADWQASAPEVRATLRGLARKRGRAVRRSAALTTRDIRRLAAACGDDLRGIRDRALRRSELTAVEREHVTFRGAGFALRIPRGKTDQEGKGAEIWIARGTRPATCPARSLGEWLGASGCADGPVFRGIDRWGNVGRAALSAEAVRQVLLRCAAQAGIRIPPGERLSPTACAPGSSRKPTGPGRATSRSWRTPATPTSGRCTATSGARSSASRARPGCSGSDSGRDPRAGRRRSRGRPTASVPNDAPLR